MSDEFAATIATLQSHLQKQEDEVRSTKRLINQLCQRGGDPILYPDAEGETASPTSLRRDQFYGLPLAAAIRKYLELRRNMGPATVNDIFTALSAGGFKFEAKNEANAKRALYISLAKNSAAFHKLPNSGTDDAAVFGLLEWYPNAKDEGDDKKGKKSKKVRRSPKPPQRPNAVTSNGNGDSGTQDVHASAKAPSEAGKKPEKGDSHEETRSAGSAARKKHNPAPIA